MVERTDRRTEHKTEAGKAPDVRPRQARSAPCPPDRLTITSQISAPTSRQSRKLTPPWWLVPVVHRGDPRAAEDCRRRNDRRKAAPADLQTGLQNQLRRTLGPCRHTAGSPPPVS